MRLADLSIHAWIQEEKIKNEKGDLIDFKNHLFQFDIYRDTSKDIAVRKAAQVGMSTCQIIKNHYDARHQKMDIIYTLPTDNDVKVFVGGKVNRIIANNPGMLADVADKDSIEQKRVRESMIYFRGTFTKKAAIMITADRLAHDELDSSKLDIISDYQSRLQHSKFKQTHVFSHPDIPGTGVDAWWNKSDQKHWFVKCPHCNKRQFLSWDLEDPKKMSVSLEKRIFVCKSCGKELPDYARATGEWVAKYPSRKVSGYWIPLLIAPWVSASELIDKFEDRETTPWFWATRVLGIPYADGASKLLQDHFTQNLTNELYAPDKNERVVIGVDTGLSIDYVIGNASGLFGYGECKDYAELDAFMDRWPRAVAVVDAGGDLVASRKFRDRWPGRVFFCYTGGDRKTSSFVRWGKGEESGSVVADRNRMIQFVVDEFRNKKLPVHGNIDDWYDYYNDWANLSRIKVLDSDTNVVKGYKWVRSGRDHKALATVYWRVGISRFAGVGSIILPDSEPRPNSYVINPDKTVNINTTKLFNPDLPTDEGDEE